MKTPTRVSPRGKKPPDNLRKRVLWDRDSVGDGPTSIKITIDWLTTEGNYRKWKGGSKSGISKNACCTEIVAKMVENGINS